MVADVHCPWWTLLCPDRCRVGAGITAGMPGRSAQSARHTRAPGVSVAQRHTLNVNTTSCYHPPTSFRDHTPRRHAERVQHVTSTRSPMAGRQNASQAFPPRKNTSSQQTSLPSLAIHPLLPGASVIRPCATTNVPSPTIASCSRAPMRRRTAATPAIRARCAPRCERAAPRARRWDRAGSPSATAGARPSRSGPRRARRPP